MAFPKKSTASAAPTASMPAAAGTGADLGGPPDTLSPSTPGGDLSVSPAVSLGGGKKPSKGPSFSKSGRFGGFKKGGGVSSFAGGKR